MAQGDFTLFHQFLQDKGRAVHNLEADQIRAGFITSAVTPSATTANPCWGAGGSTNLSSSQVTPGGNYATGGPSVGGTYSQTSGVATFGVDAISITQHVSNPTNARWIIFYNNTAANKNCIGFLDLGAVVNLTAGNFSVTPHANGAYRLTVA